MGEKMAIQRGGADYLDGRMGKGVPPPARGGVRRERRGMKKGGGGMGR